MMQMPLGADSRVASDPANEGGSRRADKLATLRMYQSVNRNRDRPIDFRGYVGLSDGSVREWLPVQQSEGVVND